MTPYPKPEKKQKEVITSAQFRAKYGKKLSKQNLSNSTKSKKSKSNYSKKVAESDTWFSKRIRLEASDSNYMGPCICCGEMVDIRYADNGHFHSRRHKAIRWEPDNCGLQKKQHNMRMGEPEVNNGFQENLIKRIGQKRFDSIEIKRHNLFKPTLFDLDLIIEENKAIVYRLLKEKMIKKWW